VESNSAPTSSNSVRVRVERGLDSGDEISAGVVFGDDLGNRQNRKRNLEYHTHIGQVLGDSENPRGDTCNRRDNIHTASKAYYYCGLSPSINSLRRKQLETLLDASHININASHLIINASPDAGEILN
jgi:hypothetical protein